MIAKTSIVNYGKCQYDILHSSRMGLNSVSQVRGGGGSRTLCTNCTASFHFWGLVDEACADIFLQNK